MQNLEDILRSPLDSIERHVRAYFQSKSSDEVVTKKHVVGLGTLLTQSLNTGRYRAASLLLSLVQELATTPDNCRALVCFGSLTTLHRLLAKVSLLPFNPVVVELLKDLLSAVHEIAISSLNAKKIAGREVMLAVWELVTWNLAPEAKRGASFAWLELTAEKDEAEILDSAVEIVNALLEGCKENESLFSSRLNLQDELKNIFRLVEAGKDYTTQAMLFEVFYRLSRKQKTDQLLSIMGKEALVAEFAKVKSSTFQMSTRNFLIFLNDSLKRKRVFSFPFTRLTLNGVHLSQSWIDFGELAVTFYWNPGHCSAPELFPDQGPLPVRIPYEIVTATQVTSSQLRWRFDGDSFVVAEILPSGGHHVLEIEFSQPEDLLVVQQAIIPQALAARGIGKSVTVRSKASRATMPQTSIVLSQASPAAYDRRKSFFTSQSFLSEEPTVQEEEAALQQLQAKESPQCSDKRARSDRERTALSPSTSETESSPPAKRARINSSSSTNSPATPPRADKQANPSPPTSTTSHLASKPESPTIPNDETMHMLRSLQQLLNEKVVENEHKHKLLCQGMNDVDHHLTTLWDGDTQRENLLTQHGQALENLERQCLSTIRDMKNEQEAYNAKMNAKIQEQLNGWVALRENMTTFSLQIKSLELDQQHKKKELKTLVHEKKVQLLTSSER